MTLTEEQETLLVPLFCRAQDDNAILLDEKAKEIVQELDFDFDKLAIPRKTCVTLCLRAQRLDEYTRSFLSASAHAVVVQLGCGLDSRFLRTDNGYVVWYDLDMAPVIGLRQKYFTETDRYHMLSASATDLDWVDTISTADRPVLVIAEGLLMYLREDDIRALVLRLQRAFPDCHLVFDAFSTMTARRVGAHPSLKKTGAHVQWGIDDSALIEGWGEGIRLREEWSFTQAKGIGDLGMGYRLGFKLAGLFPAARRAHRILYYELGRR